MRCRTGRLPILFLDLERSQPGCHWLELPLFREGAFQKSPLARAHACFGGVKVAFEEMASAGSRFLFFPPTGNVFSFDFPQLTPALESSNTEAFVGVERLL
jgi:hypothetical protein